MNEDPLWDSAKGELRILGRRYVALDVESLCRHLDSLVGPSVAEVIMRNHELRLGKEDAEEFRREKPNASIDDIIETIKATDRMSGVGITKITLLDTSGERVSVEVSNPCVMETTGAAKSLLFGYWCGVLSFLFGKEFDAEDVSYNEKENILSGKIVVRRTK